MRRIGLAIVLAVGLIVAPLSGAAQPAERAARIGFWGAGSLSDPFVAAFNEGLRELGYVEGRNISIEYRWVVTSDQLPSLAADLVGLKVDLIVASSQGAVAAKKATSTIPIVI